MGSLKFGDLDLQIAHIGLDGHDFPGVSLLHLHDGLDGVAHSIDGTRKLP